ncbi:hypothetical protein AB0H37_42255 [Actinomadura sp. NPDC023710]|uniref:hypothetical protein n=1 Tax=Actinomadura sp. NPDC023710 TaxID=3158219 RepID=UPI0033DBDCA9
MCGYRCAAPICCSARSTATPAVGLNALAVQYARPYIDTGAEITAHESTHSTSPDTSRP